MSKLFRLLLPLVSVLVFSTPSFAQDADGDGRPAGTFDCDDDDPTIYLGAEEICDDGIDQDCDVEGADRVSDEDGDGWSNADCTDIDVDCNDSDPALNLDDVDGDSVSSCAGDCDDNDATVDLTDDDGDGLDECNGDCDDSDDSVRPGAEEVCGDAVDNDCSGIADDIDVDGDGHYDEACGGDDCDDSDATRSPSRTETGARCLDELDNDCDTTIDEGDADCFGSPEANAGFDQQDAYLGGTVVVVLDASATTDPNPGDTLTYTWTQLSAEPGSATTSLSTDPTSPRAYFRFQAPADDTAEWVYEFEVAVSDGVPETEDDVDTVRVRIFRPDFVPPLACAQGSGGASGAALGTLVLLWPRRRSRR